MQILYHDKDLAVIIKPVGMDSESAIPAAIIAELGGNAEEVRVSVGNAMEATQTQRTKIMEASESFEKINTKLESLEIMVASDYVRKQDLNRFEAKIDHMNDMIINLIKEHGQR